MGMTDSQFKGFIRFLLDALVQMDEEQDETKKKEKFDKIVDNLQKVLED